MPGDTSALTLARIVDDLDDQVDDLAERANAADEGSDEERALDQYGKRVNQRLFAFEALVDEYGADASLTIASLTPGERADMNELLGAARAQWAERHGVEPGGDSLRKLYLIAAGVIEAPWYDDGVDGLQDRAVATRTTDLLVDEVIDHLWLRVENENRPEEGNSKSFAERRKAKTSTSEPN